MKNSRRDFLRKSSCGALSMAALATQMRHFGMVSSLTQASLDQAAAGDYPGYKALVCVFLSGGNDGNNLLVPNHNDATLSNYGVYNAARNTQGLALTQAQLLPIAVPRMGGLTYGLHPAFGDQTGAGGNAGVHSLWADGKMALVTNCGTLNEPMTKTFFQQNPSKRPYQLFSHSDQVTQAQTAISNSQSFTGWGGRVSDQVTLDANPSKLIPTITSIAGAQLFTNGQTTLPMAIAQANNTGASNLGGVLNPQGFNTTAASQARRTAFDELRKIDLSNNFTREASHVTDLAIDANNALQTTLEVTQAFPNTGIGLQLKQVARLIKKRSQLAMNRQVFYCQIGGFDTHNGQVFSQNNLLSQFSQAVRAFYDEMAAEGVGNDVTLFTLSDFGRTFNPAGVGSGVVGSDHAWSNHMMVIGGAVLGGDFYGVNTTNGTPFQTLTMGTAGPD
ncbi:MAG: DUF1501 domain-containing protein, partial [Acidobacteria bacterium]|nr:DUF1501 domain-containing protein [Acidobacteriota bacterium]